MIGTRSFYSASISEFMASSDSQIIGTLAAQSPFAVQTTQRDAWAEQIQILRAMFTRHPLVGLVCFEFVIPRVGRRIDVLLVINHVIFVIEFKVGEAHFTAQATDQVWDYALDLKNFHSTSHDQTIVPIVVATRAPDQATPSDFHIDDDSVVRPLHASRDQLPGLILSALDVYPGSPIDPMAWYKGHYSPTPTIVEAALALYGGHKVEDISRTSASAMNLSSTSSELLKIIHEARSLSHKCICFVTGVPGAGKTLVGLNIATQHMSAADSLYSVFLSGNGPLVSVLCEALARDKAQRLRDRGEHVKLGRIRSEVKAFVQNVHHFRDECLRDSDKPPVEHVALFDESQRAWNKEQTAAFMLRKKKRPDFNMSEPEFLISCMDRHRDWAAIVCLVGGGQEINTGEAGIGEWINAVRSSFPHWHVYLSPNLRDAEYAAGKSLEMLEQHPHRHVHESLHLSVSLRSFRSENVSALVKAILDVDRKVATELWEKVSASYPIVLTRRLQTAKEWVRARTRGTERCGLVVSSQAQRLKPHAIDVRADIDPIHWFLHPKEDVRSSNFLEDAGTEFHVQGLELDWTCVVWDADFRKAQGGWDSWAFRGTKWQRIRQLDRQAFQKNAYRVLLTRARQGMAIVVPHGDEEDSTRAPEFYDATFAYLQQLGLPIIE